MKSCAIMLLLFLAVNTKVISDDWDEFKVKRETDFSFVSEPTVTAKDKEFLISFETKSFCDVTVAIENSDGKILRHFVSGVLGSNAPQPLVSNSKKQELLFDGKDDAGDYIKDFSSVTVRVSLGIKPVYEKAIFNDPKRNHSWGRQLMVPRPEGVYIYDGGNALDFVKLFDYDGKYVKTLYPLAASQIGQIQDLKMKDLPDKSGKFPAKVNFLQTSFLNTGSSYSLNHVKPTTFGGKHYGMYGYSASFLAVSKDMIALGMGQVAKISLGSGPFNFYGPQVGYELVNSKDKSVSLVAPNASALSPDGKTLYLTSYNYCNYGSASNNIVTAGDWKTYHMVYELDLTKNEHPKLFMGDPIKEGADQNSFNSPIDIHVDDEGRIYICDYLNHRVQVFDKNKKLLKSIPVKYPAFVTVTQKNKEIIVISQAITVQGTVAEAKKNKKFSIETTMTRFGTFANLKAQPPIVFPKDFQYRVAGYLYSGTGFSANYAIDDSKGKLRVWVSEEHGEDNIITRKNAISEKNIKILELEGKEFKVIQDWASDVDKSMAVGRPVYYSRERIQYNPGDNHLYMNRTIFGFNGKSFKELFKMNPENGSVVLIELPYDAEDFCFDHKGYLYLKSLDVITRHDSSNMKEVPWDYGAETVAFTSTSSDRKVGEVISGLKVPTIASWHHGGIYVNLKGNLVFSGPLNTGDDGEIKQNFPYQPEIYQGRPALGKTNNLVYIYDKFGQVVKKDVVPGLRENYGVAIDSENNIYVMNAATRFLNGKRYENQNTCTVMKFSEKGGRVIKPGESHVALALPEAQEPKREKDLGGTWVEGAEWFYGGVGFSGKNGSPDLLGGTGCACWNARMSFDYFNRTLAPELERYRIAVIDSNGNLMLNIGTYGNRDSQGPNGPVKTGGDGIGIFHGSYLATDTDRRVFIADPGNDCITVVKIDYNTSKKVKLTK